MNPLRIGVISFVNTLPLIRGLEQNEGDYELVHASPSALADRLRYGELDAALIPAVEFFRGVGAGVVPGLCIGSRGSVESIRLLSREPLETLDRVLVDQSSRTSVAMLRLLLDRIYRVNPDFFSFRPDPDRPFLGPEGEEAPASLIIGDAAMELSGGQAAVDMDLGAWWQNTFHRPFVYALWVTRAPAGDPDHERLVELLRASAEQGQRELPLICEETAKAREWPESRVHDYLTHRIHYRLDEEALRGLSLFRELCIENYLCPDRRTVGEALAALRNDTGRSRVTGAGT
jgi:chorismate dehydratase